MCIPPRKIHGVIITKIQETCTWNIIDTNTHKCCRKHKI